MAKLHTGVEPVPLGGDLEQLLERFWSKVDRRGPSECWLWGGAKSGPNISGHYYGSFSSKVDGVWRSYRAHRVAWMLTNGPIPGAAVLRHTCDVTLCVNPFHLDLGTQGDNVRDALKRGRCLHGELNGRSKLTADDVRVIRASKMSNYALGKHYNIDPSHIMRIRRREKWQSVPD